MSTNALTRVSNAERPNSIDVPKIARRPGGKIMLAPDGCTKYIVPSQPTPQEIADWCHPTGANSTSCLSILGEPLD